MVTNKTTGKLYIGQTVKKNPQDRWQQHKSGRSGAKYLIRSLEKHGEDAFDFDIICECSIDDLDILEQYYIDYFKTFEYGYNLTKGGGGTKGYRLTDEHKRKLSILFASENNPMFGKKGGDNPNSGKIRTKEMIEKYSVSKIGEKNPMFGKEGTLKGKFGSEHPSSKKVERIDLLTGEAVLYDNQKMAAEMNNIKSKSSISACCLGKRKTTGGFAWRFAS